MAAREATAGTPGGRRLGLLLLGGGALLLALAGGFVGFQVYVDERYEPVVSATVTPSLPSAADLQQLAAPAPPSTDAALDDPPADAASAVEALGAVYGGWTAAPQDWTAPLWAAGVAADAVTAAYLPLSELALPAHGLAPASLVRIPAIGLTAETIALQVETNAAGYPQYESPIHDVGIVPEGANPGEVGNTWLFGHLESPLKGEGAVFRDLPKVHDLLRRGEAVYVIVDSADGSFLYQATEFRILPKEDVYFWGSDGRTATLVCSWPPFQYDERVLVTAELVGARLKAS